MHSVPPTDRNAALAELHASLDRRLRPEDVAEYIAAGLSSELPEKVRGLLPLPGTLKSPCPCGCGGDYLVSSYSLMATDFRKPDAISVNLDKAMGDLIAGVDLALVDGTDPSSIRALLDHANAAIGKTPGATSTRDDRLTADQRKAAGIEVSRRKYNRAFRAIAKLERKLDRLEREWSKRQTTQFAKSLFASRLPWEEFSADALTAAFVAYYASRRNMRTLFTNTSQVKPLDELASAMLDALENSETTNWWAVAHVYSVGRVLKHLTEEQKGNLLGLYWSQLLAIGELLEESFDPNRDRTSMTVRKGDDSSTWNMASRAWNAARVGWLNLLKGLDRLDLLEDCCPGKVQALIASDVAFWHAKTDSNSHGDTAVWATLPLPWKVVTGELVCTRADVEEACAAAGVDPAADGWVVPRTTGVTEQMAPTPELVHGISLSSPELAAILRKYKAFSGRATTFNPLISDMEFNADM